MSDGLDRILAFKRYCSFSNSIKITQNNALFSDFIKWYEYWANFQFSYETKKSSMKNIVTLMLEEVIMLDIHMSDGQIYSFLQLVFNTKKIGLTWRFDSTVTVTCAYIHCNKSLINNEPLKTHVHPT